MSKQASKSLDAVLNVDDGNDGARSEKEKKKKTKLHKSMANMIF